MITNPQLLYVYSALPVRLTIWERHVSSGTGARALRSATFDRVYKENGTWQRSRNLNLEDLAKTAILAERAFSDLLISLDEPEAA